MFKYTDLPAFAAKHHQGNRTAAVEALIRNEPNVKYVPNNAYADAKLIIAWWSRRWRADCRPTWLCALSSPGGATATNVVRSASPMLKYVFISIVNLIPGMNQTPETAASRYLQASEFGTDSQGNSSPRPKGSSQARSRCGASHTSTIAATRKLRGRPSSKSPASTCLTRHLSARCPQRRAAYGDRSLGDAGGAYGIKNKWSEMHLTTVVAQKYHIGTVQKHTDANDALRRIRMARYQDKKVVIIGGTSGMGLATVKMLLDGGARVLVTGRSQAGLEFRAEELGIDAIVVSSDARSLTDIDALAAR